MKDVVEDNLNQMKEVVEVEKTNSDALADFSLIGAENSALKQKKLPWLRNVLEESVEEMQKEEKKDEEKEEGLLELLKKMMKMPWSSFPPEREPLHGDTDDDDETDSDEESDNSSNEDRDDSSDEENDDSSSEESDDSSNEESEDYSDEEMSDDSGFDEDMEEDV